MSAKRRLAWPRFTWPRLVAAGLLLLLGAAWYVPKISADRYREPIRLGLQNALGRKVEISEVQFQLLPVPGFTVTNVIVGEDPAIGPEPMAVISTLRGRPRLSALFGGPLEFASVDLEDTSVNLTRVNATAQADAGTMRWNFSSLMRPKLLAAFPSVHLIGGRVNFKFGDTKSVFYLLNTDVDLWPPDRADGPWTVKVHSYPARTDRPSHGFGSFIARGEWHPANGLVTLDVKLEKSELGDVVTLFEGRESYLQGHVWGDAHLSGPVSRVGVSGLFRVDDIHGWNQTPPGGGAWPITLGGAIDVPGQTVDIRATTEGKQPPIDVRLRVTNYLARPRWGVTLLFSQLAMTPLVQVARNLGFGIPGDLSFEGTAQGAVGYSLPEDSAGPAALNGQVRIENSTLTVAGSPALHVSTADLQFAGSTITLSPASITNDSHESAAIAAGYDLAAGKLDVTLSSEGMAVASLQKQVSVAHVPLLSLATSGAWSGMLHYTNLPDSLWTGDVHLKDVDVPFEAFASPVHLTVADASLSAAGLVTKRLAFTAGGIEGQGEYRYETGSARPHRYRLTLGRVNGAVLEKLLMPALHRGSFLTYAFNFGRVPEPDWMRSMHSDGTLQVASVDFGGAILTKLKARVQWDGDEARLSGLQANLGDAALAGSAIVNLAQRQPRYDLTAKLSGFAWHSGTLDLDGTMTTSGTGGDLLQNLKSEGKLRGKNLDLAPLDACERLESSYDFSWNGKQPHLKLSPLTMTAGGTSWQGTAETQADGQLVVKASDGTKQIQSAIKP